MRPPDATHRDRILGALRSARIWPATGGLTLVRGKIWHCSSANFYDCSGNGLNVRAVITMPINSCVLFEKSMEGMIGIPADLLVAEEPRDRPRPGPLVAVAGP